MMIIKIITANIITTYKKIGKVTANKL